MMTRALTPRRGTYDLDQTGKLEPSRAKQRRSTTSAQSPTSVVTLRLRFGTTVARAGLSGAQTRRMARRGHCKTWEWSTRPTAVENRRRVL